MNSISSCDDCSAIFINGTEVVNNDGLHGNTNVTGSYTVGATAARSQSFELVYFNHNYTGGAGGANLSFTSPSGVIFTGSAAAPEPGAIALLTLNGSPAVDLIICAGDLRNRSIRRMSDALTTAH